MPPTFEQVVGVPVTLNGDLKNQFVETTVGFDTICKVGTAEMLNSHHYACSLCLYGDAIIFVVCIVCYCVLWALVPVVVMFLHVVFNILFQICCDPLNLLFFSIR